MSQNTTAMQRGAGGETTGATDMTTRQPEALDLADWLIGVGGGPSAQRAAALLRSQHARITELEAQLEAVGAGGVGPLIACAGFSAADMATAGQPAALKNLWPGALDIRMAQGRGLKGDRLPVLYTDTINGDGVCRDDLWLCTSEALKPAEPVAEPAPSATAHVGDSLFESWFSEYNPAHRGTKQQMRDAYAAGMDDGKVAPLPSAAYAALPESFLEIPDVQDESGINAYYSREAVLECIDAALASHGQAPAQPDPAYSEACNLATALFKKHFAHLPDYASGQVVWGLFDSTEGVILQIDNMVAGLVQPPTTSPQAASVLYDPKAVLDVFNSARAGSDKSSGYLRGILAVIAHWESRPEPYRWMVPAQPDSALEDAARLLALEAAANQIFNNPPSETSQDVRDVIEWFSGSIRVVLDAARKQGATQ